MRNVCEVCKKPFSTDERGRRESDWIICARYCDIRCNLAAVDIEERQSIYKSVADEFISTAARRILNIGDMWEFKTALFNSADSEGASSADQA